MSRTKAFVGLLSAALLTLALGWRIVRHAAADMLVGAPVEALSWDARDPRTLTALVRKELATAVRSDNPSASAVRLLSVDPLAFEGLSLYGAALARAGHGPRIDEIFKTAAAHSALDRIAHGQLFFRAVTSGNFNDAFKELDILARGRPDVVPSLARAVKVLIANDPIAEAALARLLASRPPWRQALLTYLCYVSGRPDGLARLYEQLRQSAAPPTDAEMSPYLEQLVRAGRIEDAYLAWLGHLPEQRLSKVGAFYNGGFEYPMSNLPFDWRFIPVAGATMEVASREQERVLVVRFFGARVAFRHVVHLLALSPGTYEFSGSAKLLNVENERGLRWRIVCSDSSETLATTELLTGTTPWLSLRARFTIAAEGCAGQWLVLEIPARAAVEAKVSGEARYKDLGIARLDTSAELR